MFNKAALFIIVTLAMFASPVPQPEGVAIPIHRRTTLTLPNGIFDHNKAILATIRTMNKHRQNLINLKNNLGKDTFPKGAEIWPLAKIPENLLHLLEKRGSEPLIDENSDADWAGKISIGTPGKTFLVGVDTGSSDLWVPSSSCRSAICAGKNLYNKKSSSTSKLEPGTFSIQYGDGSSVSGPIYTKTVTVGEVTATGQYFSPVTTLSSSFSVAPIDGIFGLAFPAISQFNQNPFFNTAFSEGAVASNLFSLKLAKDGSELYLGGVNEKLYTGLIESHSVSSPTGFWQIGGASISVNGKHAVSGFETIIDSGTTIIYGPPSAVSLFYSKVPGSAVFDPTSGFYSFPCNSVLSVSFNWGGKDWVISSSDFNLGAAQEGSDQCIGALTALSATLSAGLGNNVWVLGDSFMKNVYTIFDFGSSAVGFATLV